MIIYQKKQRAIILRAWLFFWIPWHIRYGHLCFFHSSSAAGWAEKKKNLKPNGYSSVIGEHEESYVGLSDARKRHVCFDRLICFLNPCFDRLIVGAAMVPRPESRSISLDCA
jgi:hypothetical protein